MQRLEVSGAVRPIYGSLGVEGLIVVFVFCGGVAGVWRRVTVWLVHYLSSHRGGLETSGTNHTVTRHHIPEERRPQIHRCEVSNLEQVLSVSCICQQATTVG